MLVQARPPPSLVCGVVLNFAPQVRKASSRSLLSLSTRMSVVCLEAAFTNSPALWAVHGGPGAVPRGHGAPGSWALRRGRRWHHLEPPPASARSGVSPRGSGDVRWCGTQSPCSGSGRLAGCHLLSLCFPGEALEGAGRT